MIDPVEPIARPHRDTRILAQAIGYALDATSWATPDLMPLPTPCSNWDLRTLLLHACESSAALTEGFTEGKVRLRPAVCPAGDPAAALRVMTALLLGACQQAGDTAESRADAVSIEGLLLPPGALVAVGALEFAVHGWDISQSCGRCEPIPRQLALDLLRVAPSLVTAGDRHPLFAAPVAINASADPSARLLAFLGRTSG